MGEANRRGNRELRVKLARAKRVDEIRKKAEEHARKQAEQQPPTHEQNMRNAMLLGLGSAMGVMP